jgi:death-on-curing protein
MIKPSLKAVVGLHSSLIEKSGGLDGVRDEHLLDSALNAPFQTFGGQDLYQTLEEKAAQLAFSLIHNHPFQDGNKRIGIAVMAAFLKSNGISLHCSDEELVCLGLGLADNTLDKDYLKEWIITHT